MSDEATRAEKITGKIEPPPDYIVELRETLVSGFARVDERLDAMDANLDLQKHNMVDVTKRMTAMEERITHIEGRQNTHSERAKGAALTDEKHDAAIAMLHTKIDDNTAKTEAIAKDTEVIRTTVVGVINNPKVRFVGRMLFIACCAYAAAKGIKVLP